MRRAASLLIVFVLMLVALAGCRKPDGVVPVRRLPRTFTNIISLSPSTTEVLVSNITVSGTLKGRTEACNYPPNVTNSIPVVASVKPDFEKIAALQPDMIVYDASLFSAADQEKIKSLGATTFGFTANSIEEFSVQLFELANLLGNPTGISSYVDKIQAEKAAAAASTGNPKRVAVVLPGANGSNMIVGTKSFLADVVRAAGGEPVGPDSTEFVALNPETFVSLNPQTIIVPGSPDDVKGALQILQDPRFKTVDAVKNREVRPILGDVLLRKGARVDKLINGVYRSITAG